MVDPFFWAGKKILVTGHTGFKGSWLCHWLSDMGAEVSGYALAPTPGTNLYDCIGLDERMRSVIADIGDLARLSEFVSETSPDVVFHLAAQSLVRRGYQYPIDTFATNVVGTANLLTAIGAIDHACSVIVVTSDKCYLNSGESKPYAEEDPLGGHDPYSASKACTEIVTASYRQSYFQDGQIGLASVRAGNVIGGGDWAEDRLIPDMIRAWVKDEPLKVRNPAAIRPWQHVLEPLSGYLRLAERIGDNPDFRRAWNFGPRREDMVSVLEVLQAAQAVCPEMKIDCMAEDGPHEAGILMLDSSKAKQDLGWQSAWPVGRAVSETVAWYKSWRSGDDLAELTSSQIQQFCENS